MGLSKEPLQWRLGRNIYITSDEEIKEGDWFIDITLTNNGLIYKSAGFSNSLAYEGWVKSTTNIIKEPKTQCKKIILTTDQDLIKDSVQAIDDEFLEWFIKNPSCEEVEVIKHVVDMSIYVDDIEKCNDTNYVEYEIIIPKQESKQETLEEAKKQQFKYDNLQDAKEISSRVKVVETLEEAAERIYPKNIVSDGYDTNFLGRVGLYLGAKWQQDKICDSEVIQRIRGTKSDAEARRIIRTI
jgi:hypothetical protein